MGNQHGVRGKAGKRRVSGQGTHSARPERSVQRDEEVSLSVLVVLSEEHFERLGRLPRVVVRDLGRHVVRHVGLGDAVHEVGLR